MSSTKKKNYFYYIFATLLLALGAFLIFKIYLPQRLFPDNQALSPNIIIDSLAIEAIANTEINDTTTIDSTSQYQRPHIPEAYILSSSEYMEGYSNLLRFYQKLYNLETKGEGKVRIAYFGDSMTDGDYIVQDIRRQFQERYGGKGVGFVGMTSLSASSRYSISHKYSKNWKTISFLRNSNPPKPFGIDGQVVFASQSDISKLEYKANDWLNCEKLNHPTLFYGQSATATQATVSIDYNSDSISTKSLNAQNILNTLTLTSKSPQKLKLEFSHTDSIPFYGVNFDNGKGVHVDNFSMRGNSGLPLSILNPNLMREFDRILQYDLIILQYGANVLGHGSTNYSWYEKRMTQVVHHLQACFPNADIIVVSTADKSTKVDMEMQTDKAVEPLAISQKYYATNTNSGFINLYQLMGGKGSMVKWVEEKPTLANKDYTHFNNSGSRKVASLIYKELDKGYEKYKQKKSE